MPSIVHAIPYSQVQAAIRRLIDNMVNIRDESGKFLLRLDDGRVIDTKGWNDWEWTHGIGLYGIFRHWELSGDPQALQIMQAWFRECQHGRAISDGCLSRRAYGRPKLPTLSR
jgi:unsaturated rhamnogalacturonyl hydrolase